MPYFYERAASDTAAGSRSQSARTAVLVTRAGAIWRLCPFFNKCDGILLHGMPEGTKEFHQRDRSGVISVCSLILELRPARLICGFVAEPERKQLQAAGIDVRLGSCACSIDELLASVATLPKA